MIDAILELFGNYTFRNVILGSTLLGVVSGILSCFTTLRREGLLGDALSHAVLPGICLAFIVTGSKSPLVLTVGAGVAGFLGTMLILGIRNFTKLREDAALGIVLSTFFGFGIVLLTVIAKLNRGNQAGLDSFLLGQAATLLWEDVLSMIVLTAIIVAVVIALYKEFKLITFDPEFARSLGFNSTALSALLISLVTLTVIIGLRMVGVILMAAMVIGPGVAARQWTNRFGPMMAISAVFGIFSGISGSLLSIRGEGLPTGPMIVLALTAIVLVSLFVGKALKKT